MAHRIRTQDWAETPLGPIETWPQSLRTAVELMLSTALPTWMQWGPEAVIVYNDAYARLLGERHPRILGRPVFEALPASWANWEAVCRRVLSGQDVKLAKVCHVVTRNDVREEIWVDGSAGPIRDESGRVAGLWAVFIDITAHVAEKSRRTERALRASEARYRQLFDSIDQGFCVIEMIFDAAGKPVDYRFLEVNAAFERQTGLVDALGKTMRSFEPEHEEYWFEIYGRIALTGEPIRFERAAQRLERYYEVYAFRVGAAEERKVGVLFNDISARKAAEEHRTLLIQELNHRVKNTLAMIQALARKSFAGKDVPKAVLRSFEGRLSALARAHDLITKTQWEKMPLKDVAENAVRWCGADTDRFSISGPPVTLQPQKAVAISMALHELCTNAIKYGALCKESGRIGIEWHVCAAREPTFRLEWRERGGPAVRPPEHRGFGSMMVEHSLAHELDGCVNMDFRNEGLVCTLKAPLSAVGTTR